MKTNYLSLTIGPLAETMSYCQKTRELWVGSYFFSYFMRELIAKLSDEIKVIIPYVDEEKSILSKYREEGIFHDRFIAKSSMSKEELKEELEEKITQALEQVVANLNIDDAHYDALKAYLQYHYIIATEDELLKTTGKQNAIFAIDAILDSLELQLRFDLQNSTKVATIDKKDHPNKIEGLVTPLAKLQYETKRMKDILDSNLSFKSIPAIAITHLKEEIDRLESNELNKRYRQALKTLKEKEKEFPQKNQDEDDLYERFYKSVAGFPDFRQYHKYYAVVYADGDKMGSTIRSIYEGESKDEDIEKFSKNIFEYISSDSKDGGQSSLYRVIDDFGGMLIFAGGDDLLMFLPILGKDGKSFFEMLELLSARFKEQMQKGLDAEVSLSFGVSIQYYKSPMIEAINNAKSLLFDDAKKNNTKEKSGSVAVSLIKHSKQTYKSVFLLDDTVYKQYKKIFETELNESDAALPHSIQYALKKVEPMVIDYYKNYQDEADSKIEAIFKNLLKDGSQADNAQKALDMLCEYLKLLKPNSKKSFTNLTSQLALVKFLRGDR